MGIRTLMQKKNQISTRGKYVVVILGENLAKGYLKRTERSCNILYTDKEESFKQNLNNKQ